jgi:glycosyltransferase involved in cell wall biosynthesis
MDVQVWCDEFPVLSETFVVNEARALAELGHRVTVVAGRRAERRAVGVHDLAVRYLEDATRREQLAATVQLVLRRPLACARDLVARWRWRRAEAVVPLRALAPVITRTMNGPRPVLHAHFAASAALNAMRSARIADVSWTLTAHAYDIYQLPRNLALKVRSAELVTSGCDYTVSDLRRIAGPGREQRVIKVVMGIDPERFARETPVTESRTVIAIGRLVEKKGFEYLVRAAAEPALRELAERIVIVGDGPLGTPLRALARELGVDSLVRFEGSRQSSQVRALLEEASVLAMPSVVAADGDRDSMPIVVKEALAMEVPVVCSDEVGLPELVQPEWGRLVPPGDPERLARALAELLSLPAAERAAMGAAGRRFVTTFADVRTETARLATSLGELSSP